MSQKSKKQLLKEAEDALRAYLACVAKPYLELKKVHKKTLQSGNRKSLREIEDKIVKRKSLMKKDYEKLKKVFSNALKSK